MPKRNTKVITQTDYSAMTKIGMPYEGYVKGEGYAYYGIKGSSVYSTQLHQIIYPFSAIVQYIDRSPEAIMQSVDYKHTVVTGDSLWKIANLYGITINSILAANSHINWKDKRKGGDIIHVGEVLMLPKAKNVSVDGEGQFATCSFEEGDVKIEGNYKALNDNTRIDRSYFARGCNCHYNPGEIRAYEPNILDRWSESSGFLGALTYSVANDLYLFAQASPFGALFVSRDERKNINGVYATQSEVESGFINGLTMLVPSPVKGQSYFKNMPKSKMYSNELFRVLNSSQFGTKYKGTFLTKGDMRFTYNRYYNKGVNSINNWFNKSCAKTIVTSQSNYFDED